MGAPRVLLVDGEPLRLRSLACALSGDGFFERRNPKQIQQV